MSALTATMLMAPESWSPVQAPELQQMIQFSVQSITFGPAIRMTPIDQWKWWFLKWCLQIRIVCLVDIAQVWQMGQKWWGSRKSVMVPHFKQHSVNSRKPLQICVILAILQIFYLNYGLCGYWTADGKKVERVPHFKRHSENVYKCLHILFANMVWKIINIIGPICLKVRDADSKTTFHKLLKRPSSNHQMTPPHMFREVLKVSNIPEIVAGILYLQPPTDTLRQVIKVHVWKMRNPRAFVNKFRRLLRSW